MLIIETNLRISDKLNNFQSRVIEVESWEYIVKHFLQKDIISKNHYDIYGRYEGTIVPRMATIENLEYDDSRLSCDIILYDGKRIKKLIEVLKK